MSDKFYFDEGASMVLSQVYSAYTATCKEVENSVFLAVNKASFNPYSFYF